MIPSNISIIRAIEIELIVKNFEKWDELMIKYHENEDFGINDNSSVFYIEILEPQFVMNITPHVSHAISTKMADKKFKYIVIDMSNIERIDSSGVGTILNLTNYFESVSYKRNMFLIGMAPLVYRIMNLVGLQAVIHFCKTVNEAKAQIQKMESNNE